MYSQIHTIWGNITTDKLEELNELLSFPEYKWVIEDFLPTYYALSNMGFELGNGYQFLPTSEENILENLNVPRTVDQLKEIEQVFADWIDINKVEAKYSTGNHEYPHRHNNRVKTYDIEIILKRELLGIAQNQFEKKVRQDMDIDFKISNILELLLYNYILSRKRIYPLEEIEFLKIVPKIVWQDRNDVESFIRTIFSNNADLLSDAVIETISYEFINSKIIDKTLSNIQYKYKALTHNFNSSSCYTSFIYIIPIATWKNKIKPVIDSYKLESVINESLPNLKDEHKKILSKIEFLQLLKQNKVDTNNRIKIEEYERYSDAIEKLSQERVVKIAKTGDILLIIEGCKLDSYMWDCQDEIKKIINKWLRQDLKKTIPEIKKENEKILKKQNQSQKEPKLYSNNIERIPVDSKRILSDTILLGNNKTPKQWGIIGKADQNKSVLLDLNSPHIAFVCGSQGSGKGYTIGVISEMLASNSIPKLSQVEKKATIIVLYKPRDDKKSEFWSIPYQNKVSEEVQKLKAVYEISPQRLIEPENFRIFIDPYIYDKSADTFKDDYSTNNVFPIHVDPSFLTGDEWAIVLAAGDKSDQTYVKRLFSIIETLQFKPPVTLDKIREALENEVTNKRLTEPQVNLAKGRLEILKNYLVGINDDNFINNLAIGGINILDFRKTIRTPDDSFSVMALILSVLQTREGFENETFVFVINEAHTYFRKGISSNFVDYLDNLIKRKRHGGNWLLLDTQLPDDVDDKVIKLSDFLVAHRLNNAVENQILKRAFGDKSRNIPLLDIGQALIFSNESSIGNSKTILANIRPRLTSHGAPTKKTIDD